MNRLPTEIKLCCKILGTAMRAMRPSIRQENSGCRSGAGTPRSRRNSVHAARTEATPWHKNVAQATPPTPM